MKTLLRFEQAGLSIGALYLLSLQAPALPLWAWALLFFAPDVSMLGYLAGNRSGAFFYNLFHHQGVAVLVAGAGYLLHSEVLIASGFLLLGHSAFDRALGYGLKLPRGFGHTHLGRVGKKKISSLPTVAGSGSGLPA